MSGPSWDYAICTTPRTGSSLLCDLLALSGAMGQPDEFCERKTFMLPFASSQGLLHESAGSRPPRLVMGEYLKRLRAQYTSPNGAFGIKLGAGHIPMFERFSGFRDLFRSCRYVWLVREDIVAQAVSWHIAAETEIWDLGANQKPKSQSTVRYDAEKITSYVERIAKDNGAWQVFFAVNGFDFLPVAYEHLLEDANAVCHRICEFCGVTTEHEFTLDASWFRQQRTELNASFCERFARESPMRLKPDAAPVAPVEMRRRDVVLVESSPAEPA